MLKEEISDEDVRIFDFDPHIYDVYLSAEQCRRRLSTMALA
jgi:hypothetical protein